MKENGHVGDYWVIYRVLKSPPTVGAIVTDQLLAFIGDVGCDGRNRVQDREDGKVTLKGAIATPCRTVLVDLTQVSEPFEQLWLTGSISFP